MSIANPHAGRPPSACAGAAGLFLAAWLAAGCAGPRAAPAVDAELAARIDSGVPAAWRGTAATAAPVNPLETSEELRQFVIEAAPSAVPPRERMLLLVDALYGPQHARLSYADAATRTAAETFATGQGNCIGLANLLVAAGRAAGIETGFELLTNYAEWSEHGGSVLRTMHVRVYSRLPDRVLRFDFYPDPVEQGAWSRRLSDDQARAHHLNNLGVQQMQAGAYDRAYAYFRQALDASGELGFIWSNLGVLLVRQQLPLLAEAAFREGLNLDPEEPSAASNLERLYRTTGRDREAEGLARIVERNRERNPYYHFWSAERAYEAGDYPSAETHYRRAIRLKKDDPRFYVGLSLSYLKQGDVNRAVAAARRSQALEGTDDAGVPTPERPVAVDRSSLGQELRGIRARDFLP